MLNKMLFSVLWTINSRPFTFWFYVGWFSIGFFYSLEVWFELTPIVLAVGVFSSIATSYLEDAGFLRRVNN